jgi:hypothetical protein
MGRGLLPSAIVSADGLLDLDMEEGRGLAFALGYGFEVEADWAGCLRGGVDGMLQTWTSHHRRPTRSVYEWISSCPTSTRMTAIKDWIVRSQQG